MTTPTQRLIRLTEMRNMKMARSAHAYVRGSAVKFYEWLETTGAKKLPEGPAVWICGDCHVGNLGPLADKKGRVAVQIRDLDQTVIGNPAHDLIRLGLSLACAARGSDLPGMTTALILEQLLAGYEAALTSDFDSSASHRRSPARIQRLLQQSLRKRWQHLSLERLDAVEPAFPLGDKLWALRRKERSALTRLFSDPAVKGAIAALRGCDESDPVEIVDAAFWVKGCSSLGRRRYAVMVRIGEGKKSALCLVDLKEAVTAAAPRDPNASMPRDNAVRVVTGARALSPHLGERMIAGRLLDVGVVLREMMAQDLKIEADELSQAEATGLADYLGGVVGHAHGRQMDEPTRKSWAAELARGRKTDLDAPSWLWSSVVELLSIHELAYLEHCRRFALSQAA